MQMQYNSIALRPRARTTTSLAVALALLPHGSNKLTSRRNSCPATATVTASTSATTCFS